MQELNSGGDSALYFAIKHEQEEAVATLIEHGADVEHPASFMFNVSLLCNSKSVWQKKKLLRCDITLQGS